MSQVLAHFTTHINTYRSLANFSSMACEQYLKKTRISEYAQLFFILMNPCFGMKEVNDLKNHCISENSFTWEAWGPPLAHILNIATVVAPIFYMMGYTCAPVFIAACSSRIIPYATNFLKGSSYTPFLKTLNPQGFDWTEVRNTNLTASLPPHMKATLQELISNGSRFEAIYRRYEDFVREIRDPNIGTRDSITTFLEENRAELLEEMTTTLTQIVQDLDSIQADDEGAIEQGIQMRLSVSLRRLAQEINVEPYQTLQQTMQESLEGLRNLDLLIQFVSFLLGILYVSLLIAYTGVVPYEGLIYLSFAVYALYDFFKERKIQALDLSATQEFQRLKIALETLHLNPLEDGHTQLHDVIQALPPEPVGSSVGTPSPRSGVDEDE